MLRRSFLSAVFGAASALFVSNKAKAKPLELKYGYHESWTINNPPLSVYKVWVQTPAGKNSIWCVAESRLDAADLFAQQFGYEDKDGLLKHAKCTVFVGQLAPDGHLEVYDRQNHIHPFGFYYTKPHDEIIKEGRGILPAEPYYNAKLDGSSFVLGYYGGALTASDSIG